MIPLLAYLRICNRQSGSFGLWIPLFLLWFMLAPFALLLSPVFVVVCLVGELDPRQALATVWNILAGLKNTSMEVAHRETSILIDTF